MLNPAAGSIIDPVVALLVTIYIAILGIWMWACVEIFGGGGLQ